MGRPAEARGEALIKQLASVLDEHLAGKTWLARERLILADFSIASSFALASPARFPVGDLANLNAWLNRVQALDAWKKTAPPPVMAALARIRERAVRRT